MTKVLKIVGIGFVLATFIAAWVAKPPSIRTRLDAEGIRLKRVDVSPDIWRLSLAQKTTKWYDLAPSEAPAVEEALKQSGFSNKFGRVTSTGTSPTGEHESISENLFTRGYRIRWISDFDRVWIVEYKGQMYIGFAPDLR